jgi:hypothetical protein
MSAMDQLPTNHYGPKTESPAESTSFHLFSELPPELQLKIWEAAFDATSRRISVYLLVKLSLDRLSSVSGPTICMEDGLFATRGRDMDTCTESHSLSLACCDARKVYLLRYPETILLCNVRSPHPCCRVIRCNPAYDTLCIETISGSLQKHGTPQSRIQDAHHLLSSFKKIVSSFQHVAIRLCRDYPCVKDLAKALRVPYGEHMTVQYVKLFILSFFESIRHLYFLVKP